MHAFTINGKAVDVFLETEPGTPIIYLNTFAREGQEVFEATSASFTASSVKYWVVGMSVTRESAWVSGFPASSPAS